jgi:hypothetical protein
MTNKHRGVGLGLALVNALIRMHGGSLQLQSKVGVGTMATAIFPAWRLTAAAPASAEDAESNAGPPERRTGSRDPWTVSTD